jgi:hypothetical protein
VHVADAVQHARHGSGGGDPPEQLDVEYLRLLGLERRWPVWRDGGVVGACP